MEIKASQSGFEYKKLGSPVFVNWNEVKGFYVELHAYSGFDVALRGVAENVITIEDRNGNLHKLSEKAKVTDENDNTVSNFLNVLNAKTGLTAGQNVSKFRSSTLILLIVFAVIAITLFFVVGKLDL